MPRVLPALFAAALATVAATLLASGTPAPVSADSLVRELLDTRLGQPMADWHPPGPAAWGRYRGDLRQRDEPADPPARIWPSGLWCSIAIDRPPATERAAVFFAIRDWTPLACRLELLQEVVRGNPAEIADLYSGLEQSLSRRIGDDGQPVGPASRDVPYPWGGATGYPDGVSEWLGGRTWETAHGSVFIFAASGAIGLALRSHVVKFAADGGEPFEVTPLLIDKMSSALQARFPAVAAALAIEIETAHQPEIRRGLVEVLEARRQAAGEEHALMGLAADRLARQLWIEGKTPKEHPELAPLLSFGLRFRFDSHSSMWRYDGALARDVIRESPQSTWGELAFVQRLGDGWTEGCAGQEYVAVIRQGLAWLPLHPRSPWRVPVMTALARAYESQWSEGGVFIADPAANDRAIGRAAEAARRQALVWYARVIGLAPFSADAAYARRRIVQIKVNMDTGQEQFACAIP